MTVTCNAIQQHSPTTPDQGFIRLASSEDASVNFVEECHDGGMWESRFVQRVPEYFIVYLSSHSGCNKACRFCHLTATGQTTMTPATVSGYLQQAERVMEHYAGLMLSGYTPAKRVHFNFMARGEPLSNPVFIEHSQDIFDGLSALASVYGLESKFLVSSILPADFEADLSKVLADPRSILFYSLYSTLPEFRRRWLPKAMAAERSGRLIAEYQAITGKEIALHWAFIDSENATEASVAGVVEWVRTHGIQAKFNLVRYNPYSSKQGAEPSEDVLKALFDRINIAMSNQVASRIVPRVGYDVKASCGMFIKP